VEELYELDNLLYELEDHGGYFKDFISTAGIEAGIILLHPNEDDTQKPHSVDEVYYVIKGSGYIEINGKDHPVKQGIFIFVPAATKHRFHHNSQDLIIFYVLGK